MNVPRGFRLAGVSCGGLITSWFWLAGIVALSLLPTLVKGHLGGGKELITLGLCVFTLGIAFGSLEPEAAKHIAAYMALREPIFYVD